MIKYVKQWLPRGEGLPNQRYWTHLQGTRCRRLRGRRCDWP
jgi:hypothetical protein